jgi:hypothetical protein
MLACKMLNQIFGTCTASPMDLDNIKKYFFRSRLLLSCIIVDR